MEGNKASSTGSSFTHLFGAKEDSPSHGILASIFPPPPKGPQGQGEPSRWSESEKKTDSVDQPAKKKADSGEEEQSWSTKQGISSSYLQDENQQPFHYSSSIYYGGQDVYSRPKPAAENPTFNSQYKAEDDSDVASRGNWWQGSLYY